MNIVLGSKNPVKRAALEEAVRCYPRIADAVVLTADVSSGVRAQPHTLDEMFRGAYNRAAAAMIPIFDLAVGLESGVFQPHPCGGVCEDQALDACACVVVDRDKRVVGVGMSAAFDLPHALVAEMRRSASEMTDAVAALGWADRSIGYRQQGVIGLVTRGVMDRFAQCTQAAALALARFCNPEFYDRA